MTEMFSELRGWQRRWSYSLIGGGSTRRHRGLLGTFLLLAAITAPATAGGGAHAFGGARWFGADEPWGPSGPGVVLGLSIDAGGASWPVNIAVGYQWAGTSLGDASRDIGDVIIQEFSVGVLRDRSSQQWGRAFVGGGLARIAARAELDWDGGAEVDAVPALYGQAGAFIGDYYAIGLEVRGALAPSVDLFGLHGAASYIQVTLIFAGFGVSSR